MNRFDNLSFFTDLKSGSGKDQVSAINMNFCEEMHWETILNTDIFWTLFCCTIFPFIFSKISNTNYTFSQSYCLANTVSI